MKFLLFFFNQQYARPMTCDTFTWCLCTSVRMHMCLHACNSLLCLLDWHTVWCSVTCRCRLELGAAANSLSAEAFDPVCGSAARQHQWQLLLGAAMRPPVISPPPPPPQLCCLQFGIQCLSPAAAYTRTLTSPLTPPPPHPPGGTLS